MKNLIKLALVVIAIKGTVFAINAADLPESNHHANIEQVVNGAQ